MYHNHSNREIIRVRNRKPTEVNGVGKQKYKAPEGPYRLLSSDTGYLRDKALGISLLFFVLALGASELRAQSIFPDKALEAAVRQEVFAKRYNQEPITADDVKSISRVIAKNRKIESLEGLQHCLAVMEIDLANNLIKDLSPIANLKQVQLIVLKGNQIESIDAMKDWTKVQYLELSQNRVTSLEPLQNMTNMRSLYISGNQVASLSPLAGMKRIETLYAAQNPLTDLSSLPELKRLKSLDLSETKLSDLMPIKPLNELSRCKLSKNQITDLSPLVESCEADVAGPNRFAPFLELDISDNPLSDVAIKEQVSKLRKIGVRVRLAEKGNP